MALNKQSRQQDQLDLTRQANAYLNRQTNAQRPTLVLQPKTLHLPEEIELPAKKAIGTSFEHEGRIFRYAGEVIELVGEYRRRTLTIWKTGCTGCKGQALTRLPERSQRVKTTSLVG